MITLPALDTRRLALNSEAPAPAVLVKLDATSVGGGIARYTDVGDPVTADGETYQPGTLFGGTPTEPKGEIGRDILQLNFADADKSIYDAYFDKLGGTKLTVKVVFFVTSTHPVSYTHLTLPTTPYV